MELKYSHTLTRSAAQLIHHQLETLFWIQKSQKLVPARLVCCKPGFPCFCCTRGRILVFGWYRQFAIWEKPIITQIGNGAVGRMVIFLTRRIYFVFLSYGWFMTDLFCWITGEKKKENGFSISNLSFSTFQIMDRYQNCTETTAFEELIKSLMFQSAFTQNQYWMKVLVTFWDSG